MSLKKGLLTTISIGTCTALLYSTQALAVDKQYIAGMFGLAMFNDSTLTDSVSGDSVNLEFDPGWNLGFLAGYKTGLFRFEGEIGYQQNDFDKFSGGILGPYSVGATGDGSIFRVMFNSYCDFDTSTALTPYIGIGLGYANVELNDLSIGGYYVGDKEDDLFAYQFITGLDYAINNRNSIFVAYRYFGTNDMDVGNIDAEITSHNFSIGVRYIF